MKQLLRLLFLSLFAELWLSLEASQCHKLGRDGFRTSFCCNTSSGKTCFTTYHANISHSHPVSRPFEEASDWCKLHFPGSSLIIINSIASQRTVESFIGREVLQNETIIMDAQQLSASESLKWSWVNGQPTLPIDVRTEQFHDGACVESKRGHSLAFCTGHVKEQYSYICEYSDSRSAFSHRQSNKSYYANERNVTWYDARKECLRLGGDLAIIKNLRTIEISPQLKYNQRYWIGLHRNRWIWNSTGAAISYNNWDGGYPDESSDKQCICINPRCRSKNNRTICVFDRKWRTCNCNHNYAIVCQKEEKVDAVTTKMVATEGMLPSISTTRSTTPATSTTTSTKTPIVTVPTTTTTFTRTTRATTPVTTSTTATITPLKPIIPSVTTYTTTIAGKTAGATEGKSFSISSMKPSNQTTASESSPSTGLFKSFTITEIFLILFLFVTVVFIFFLVILVIRKCRKRNERRSMKKTKQEESVSPEYETMVPDKRPSDDIVPIYTELELTQHPMPSKSTICTNMQPTGEAVDMDINVVYADLHEV